MNETWQAGDPRVKRRPTFRWYHFYYLLAAFDLITISTSLYLSHRILSIYTESVNVNRIWAERLVAFSGLAELVTEVNAPGNDVFASRDVESETVQLDQAVSKYRRVVRDIRHNVRSNVSQAAARQLLGRLDRLDAVVDRIEDEAHQIFRFTSNGQTGIAGQHMSVMDRHFAAAASEITHLVQDVGAIQEKHFASDLARAQQLEWFETAIAGCIIVIICGVTFYGHSLSKRMAASEVDLIKATEASIEANRAKDDLLIQLRSSETRLKSMFASSQDPLITINQSGIVKMASNSVESVFGWTPNELIGQNVNLLMPEPHRSEHDGHLARYQRSGVPHLLRKPRELSAVRRDGTVFPCEVMIWKVNVPDSTEQLFMGIIHDITDRKRANAALRRFRAALDASPDAIFVIDRKGMSFVDMNETACDSMGYSRDELLAMGPQDIKPKVSEQELAQKFDEIIETEDQMGVIETVHRRKDGSTYPVEIFLRVLEADDGTLLIASVREITERKRSEAELESLNRQLVDAARQAGKSEIATSVLHNVGNVLNSVNVSAGVVQEKVRGSGVFRLNKAMEIMEQHLDDLGTYVTQDERGKHLPRFLIDVSQQLADNEETILEEVESLVGNIDHIKTIVATQQAFASGVSGVIEEVSLAVVLEDAIRINRASMQRHSVPINREFDDVAPILVDKQKLLQIVVNLISNAKYACLESDNEAAEVTVSVRRSDEDYVSIEVSDSGMGIATENLTRIFAHGFTTREEGHGFGLHSAALAAKELDGSLTVHSDGPETGATFTLEIPYQEAGVSLCTS